MNKITIHQGHVLQVLSGMASESVHMICTSPPYWGLRDYGIPPVVWPAVEYAPMAGLAPIRVPGDEACEHEWGDELIEHKRGKVGEASNLEGGEQNRIEKARQGQFCLLCGAWKGSLGLEPTLEMFVGHLVLIGQELRRVLRKDGVFFLNIGDSYAGSGGAHKDYHKNPGLSKSAQRDGVPLAEPPRCLKPKDLCGIPWRLALALQADGWWLRSEIIWSKPNPMPESCTDRPTRSHEYIFILTKSASYAWDKEAVREASITNDPRKPYGSNGAWELDGRDKFEEGAGKPQNRDASKRNLRSVWTIATEPFPGAHFATFPQELVRRCVAAGTSEKGCCPKCSAPWKRVVEKVAMVINRSHNHPAELRTRTSGTMVSPPKSTTLGWLPTCGCEAGGPLLVDAAINGAELFDKMEEHWLAKKPIEPISCTVLDPFAGAGTVGLVAGKMGRDAVLIEIKPEYCAMSEKRIKDNLGMLVEIDHVPHP